MTRKEKKILSKETELKDNWRYSLVGKNDWIFDRNPTNPEDEIISLLDGDVEETERPSGIEMLERLNPIQKKIVYYYLWEGFSFGKIGKMLGFTKQRIHQIYWEGINSLK